MKKNKYGVLLDIIYILLGGFLIFNPSLGLGQLVKLFAILLFLYGLGLLLIYFWQPVQQNNRMLYYATGTIIFGGLLFFFHRSASEVVLPTLIGCAMLAAAVLRGISTYRLRELNSPIWWLPLIAAFISVLLAIVILTNLMASSIFFAIVLGLYLVAFGALGIGEEATLRTYNR